MSTLETRIAEVVAQALELDDDEGVFYTVAPCEHPALIAAALAPAIREAQAEASAQAFQSVRDNAEFEPEERDGPNLIIAAYLMIDVDKLNALDKSHDGMDWVRFTATDYANELRKVQAEAWDACVHAADKQWTIGHTSAQLLRNTNPYRSNDE